MLSSAVSTLPAARGPSPSCSYGMFLPAQLVKMAKRRGVGEGHPDPCPTRPKHPPLGSHHPPRAALEVPPVTNFPVQWYSVAWGRVSLQ